MKLILAVDPLLPPLTGIGRYTLELAIRLPQVSEIESIKYYNLGKWERQPGLPGSEVNDPQKELGHGMASRIRTTLSRSKMVMSIYGKVAPRVESFRLAPFTDHLYHSPNFFAPRFAGKKIVTIHDLSIFRYPEFHPPARVSFMKDKVSQSMEHADHFIAVSRFSADEMIDYFGIAASRITVTPLGVADSYCPRSGDELDVVLSKYGLASRRYFLSVATLEPRKNIRMLLRAYGKLPSVIRNLYPLVLCGNAGWENQQLMQDIAVGERAGWVKRIGYIAEADMPFLYSGAKGFLYPSFYEGFGLPILEAFACCCPVICSGNSALAELVDGAAEQIDPEDESSIALAIEGLVDEDEKWPCWIKKASEVAEYHTWDRCIQATIKAYQAA